MLACDLVVAAETARFGVPEVKRALVAGAGAAVLLPAADPADHRPRAAAHRRADRRPAGRRPRAWSTGSRPRAARSTAPSSWPRRSRPTARWRSRSPSRSPTSSRDWSTAEGWQKQSELMMPVFVSEDAQEGATAFAEKRRRSGRAVATPRASAATSRVGREASIVESRRARRAGHASGESQVLLEPGRQVGEDLVLLGLVEDLVEQARVDRQRLVGRARRARGPACCPRGWSACPSRRA